MTEPGAVPGAEPRWASLDLAWPLALVGGFAGTWAGLSIGLAGAPAALATAALVPLHLALSGRGALGASALVGLGWGLGIAGAVAGAWFEGAGPAIREAQPLLALERAAADLGPGWHAGAHLGLFALALLIGCWSRGLGTLLVAAEGLVAAAATAAEHAVPAVQGGTHAVLATLAQLPASATAEALALLMAAVALAGLVGHAGPRRPAQAAEAAPAGAVRSLLWGAVGLEFLALAGWSLG